MHYAAEEEALLVISFVSLHGMILPCSTIIMQTVHDSFISGMGICEKKGKR